MRRKHPHLKYAATFAASFVLTGTLAWTSFAATDTSNPLLVADRLNAKGAKPVQSITIRVMPEAVFAGQSGSVYISHKSETSCVAWVDQAAVAGRKHIGKDVLRAAFEECGKTFE